MGVLLALQAGGFDPTQIPDTLFVEQLPRPPLVAPQYESFVGWLSAEAGGADAVFDYWTDAQRPWVPRENARDEASDQAWLSSEAGPGDAVFDYFQPSIPGAIPRTLANEELIASGWLSSEADPGPQPWNMFADAQRPNPLIGTAEGADVSWSPDSFAPPFDPTTLPEPASVEPLPLTPFIQPQFEAWVGWTSSEAGPGDAVFDYVSDAPRFWVQRLITNDELIAPIWLSSEAGPGDAVFDYFADAQRQNPPIGTAEGADVSWSPDVGNAPPFDPTQIPDPLFFDAPPAQSWRAQDEWSFPWLSNEAGGTDAVFDYFVPDLRVEQRKGEAWREATEWLAQEAGPGSTVFDFYAEAPPSMLWRAPAEIPDISFIAETLPATSVPAVDFSGATAGAAGFGASAGAGDTAGGSGPDSAMAGVSGDSSSGTSGPSTG